MNGWRKMSEIFEKYYREIPGADGSVAEIETLYEENFNFAYDVVDRFAESEPDRLALVHKSVDGIVTRFSFGNLKKLSDTAASAMQRLGIGKGMPVFLLLKRRFEFWIAILALHKLGAIAVPTSHMVSSEDIRERCRKAGAKAVLCVNSDDICDKVKEAIRGTRVMPIAVGKRYSGFLYWEDVMRRGSARWERVQTNAADPMLYFFTSGTNGAPKAVIHDFTYPIAHIYTAKRWHGVRKGDLHLTVADTGWAKTAWGKLYGQWFLGAAVMVYDYDHFYAGEMLRLLEEQRVNTFCAPPTIYKYLVTEDLSQYDLSSVHHVSTAGEPMPVEVARKFFEATGKRIRDGYGQTETTLLVCTPAGCEPIPGALGKASPQYRLSIVDENGDAVADGEEGEIVIVPKDGKRPVGILCGYLGEPERYAEVWRGGVYHTGDRAKRDAQGNFFYVGRTDDVIKSSGYRIGPSEVEDLLMCHPAVRECAVTGYPSKSRGTVVKATVVLKDGVPGNSELKNELQELVKKRGAIYKYPRMIDFVKELPHTVTGKINRAVIRERDRLLAAGRA